MAAREIGPIAAYDGLPFGWNLRTGTTSRVRTTEAYLTGCRGQMPSITGVSGRAEAGPLCAYIRGEYQYASSMPAYSGAVQ